MIVERDIVADFAVVSVHVMYCKSQIRHVVAAKNIVAATVDKDTVPTITDGIVFDDRTGGIPQIDTITAIVDAVKLTADDHIVADNNGLRAFQVKPYLVMLKMVGFDKCAVTSVGDKNSAVFIFQHLA